ncbi:hypothetical protein ACWGKQ_19370 [Streptomyces sp. NPDC054770]
MAVFGIRAWWGRLRGSAEAGASGDPPTTASNASDNGARPLDDTALKAYAMQRPEWAEALIQVENARVAGEIRLLSARLLLGTACGSVLLLSITVAARVAPSIPLGSMTPLSTAVVGAVSAAILTALGAGLGRTLSRRSADAPAAPVSGAAAVSDRPPEGGSEPGAAQ